MSSSGAKQNGQQASPSPQQKIAGASSPDEVYRGMMEWIADSDLNEGSKNLLKNLLSKELVLANFTKAEVNEWRWKLRRKKELFFLMHPGPQCLVIGEDRGAIYDDPHASLSPLSDQQRQLVRDLFDVLEARITRARGMKQQEMVNTDIHEHRDGNDEESSGSSSGGLRGWLSR